MDELKNFLREISNFRKELKLSQKDFGEKLGLSIRQVNYIESGQRQLNNSELKRLYDEFNHNISPSLKELILSKIKFTKPAGSPFILMEEYAEKQQEFLKTFEYKYSMWLLNMAEIAMLRSNRLEETWSENINEGVNYSVVWDLSYFEDKYVDSFEDFTSACLRILEKVKPLAKSIAPETNNQNTSAANDKPIVIGIDVYAFYYKNHLDTCLKREKKLMDLDEDLPERFKPTDNNLIKAYLKAWKRFQQKSESSPRLKFHIPFAEEEFNSPDHWRLFKDTILRRAGTVLYKPNKGSKGLDMAVLEPQGVCKNFDDKEDDINGFLFLGDSWAKHHNDEVSFFEEWFKTKFETPEMKKQFEEKFNPINIDFLLTL